MNAGETTCRMCDQPLYWARLREQWQHTENRSIYCPGKSASVAEPEPKESTMHEHNDTICNNPETLCADCTAYAAEDAEALGVEG